MEPNVIERLQQAVISERVISPISLKNWMRAAFRRFTPSVQYFPRIMAGEISIDISPPKVSLSSGQTTFDRDLFRKSIPVLAARVPASQTTKFLKAEALRGCVISRE
jgi:tRNA (guanine37-N1)-methyltransferase